jgi:hypothetical protein
MKDADALHTVAEILRLETNSFIRYCVQSGQTVARDTHDRKVYAALQDWYRATELSCRALRECLADANYFPSEGGWPLHFAQFNFVRPTYLVQHVVRLMDEVLTTLREKAGQLESLPEARDLVTAIVEREQVHLDGLKKLDAERPKDEPTSPVIKGTSASRW